LTTPPRSQRDGRTLFVLSNVADDLAVVLERWRSFRGERPGVVEPLTAVLLRPSSLRAQFLGLESVPCPEVGSSPERWPVPKFPKQERADDDHGGGVGNIGRSRSVIRATATPSAVPKSPSSNHVALAYDRLQEY